MECFPALYQGSPVSASSLPGNVLRSLLFYTYFSNCSNETMTGSQLFETADCSSRAWLSVSLHTGRSMFFFAKKNRSLPYDNQLLITSVENWEFVIERLKRRK